MEFKDRLKELRIKKGLSQQQLGEIVGVTKVSVCGYENGSRVPSLETFADICIALSTTPDYLLLGTLKSNSVPQTIIDGLNLCDNESLSIINDIISCFSLNVKGKWKKQKAADKIPPLSTYAHGKMKSEKGNCFFNQAIMSPSPSSIWMPPYMLRSSL